MNSLARLDPEEILDEIGSKGVLANLSAVTRKSCNAISKSRVPVPKPGPTQDTGLTPGDFAELEQLKQVLYATDQLTVLVCATICADCSRRSTRCPTCWCSAERKCCHFFDREVLFRHAEQDELDIEPIGFCRPQLSSWDAPRPNNWRNDGQCRAAVDVLAAAISMSTFTWFRTSVIAKASWTPVVVSALHRANRQDEVPRFAVLASKNAICCLRRMMSTLTSNLPPSTWNCFDFRSNLRSTYFPAIRDFSVIDKLLVQDVDADALFREPALSVPDPVICTDTSSDESHDYYYRRLAMPSVPAPRVITSGFRILHTKAAPGSSPVARMQSTRALAFRGMEAPRQHDHWVKPAPRKCRNGCACSRPCSTSRIRATGRLRRNCCSISRKSAWNINASAYILDVVEWALSGGATSNGLSAVCNWLARPSTPQGRQAFYAAAAPMRIGNGWRGCSSRPSSWLSRVREKFRPILNNALHDVGLLVTNPPNVASTKSSRSCSITFWNTATSASPMSAIRFAQPAQARRPAILFRLRGDPLGNSIHGGSALMKGVYHRGEFYLRCWKAVARFFRHGDWTILHPQCDRTVRAAPFC